MAITPLTDVTLTAQEEQTILNTLIVPWSLVFEVIAPGSSRYLSYRGNFGDDPEDLAHWRWLGEPENEPDTATLLAAFAAFAPQFEADNLEAARVAKWKALVDNEVNADVQAIPAWFSWTEEQALTWIDTNLAPELSASAPKTLVAVTSLARMLIAIRNQLWPHFEGS